MHYLQVIGRLKPGVTPAQARGGMGAIAAHIAQIAPETNRGWGITIEPLRQAVVGQELRATSLALAGVVAFVLLMACANVASLILARGADPRARNGRARLAGCGGGRLVRQLFLESLLLAALGGGAGVGLAGALIRVAPAIIPAGTLPTGMGLALDSRVLAFSVAVTLATGLLFGIVPAWRITRGALADSLRAGGRGATAGNQRALDWLAAVEIAVAVMVVTGAGLFLRTLDRLARVDPGYHAERVLTMHVSLPLARYREPRNCLVFYQAALREIESIPGIHAASFGGSLPLTGFNIGQGFKVVGEIARAESLRASAHYQIVGARYFETLGIRLVAGRPFAYRDTSASPPVAIVNEEFVRRYLPGRDPIGVHVAVQAMDPAGPRYVDREIVGVSSQVKVDSLGETRNTVEIYVPISQNPWYDASLSIRAALDPGPLAAAVRAAIARVDKDLALTQVRTMDEIAAESVARPRFRARLLAGFAALALLVSATGVFGVLAFSVSRRRREFGVRMALGAQARGVLVLVLGRAVRLAVTGVAAGLLAAAALARGLSALLFGVQPIDPATFAIAALTLTLVALAAAAIPAWRAAGVDPSVVLREE